MKLQENLGLVATVSTILIAGVTIGALAWNGSNSLLRDQRDQLQREVDALRNSADKKEEEADKLRKRVGELLLELQRHQGELQRYQGELKRYQEASGARSTPPETPGRRVTIHARDSGSVASVSISVPKIEVLYDPFRYQVTAVFNEPTQPSLESRLEVGTTVTYGGYEIRLLRADLNTAQFSVEKVSGQP